MTEHSATSSLRKALQAARRREAQLRQVLDLVPDYIFANDEDGNVLLANAALAEAYGVSAVEMENASTLQLDPDPAQAERLLALDREVIAGGKPVHVPEMELVDASGRRLVVELRMIPYVDTRTGKNAVVGVGVDITGRREAEAEIARSRARLEDAIESVADGLMLFDSEDRLVMKNTRMRELVAPDDENVLRLGASFERIVRAVVSAGRYDSIDGADRQDNEHMVATRLALHRDAPSLHEQQLDHGMCRLVSTRPTAEGGRIVVYTDITELKRQEQALREKERVDRELEIARQIQRALLPDATPDVPGFEIAGWNEPADHTGGDYYDWLTLPDGRVLVTIADVTGHGIGPAILVSACRAYLRSCSQVDSTLERVMTRVNELMSPDLSGGRFVTAAVGILEPRTCRMHLYSAGHGPILYYSARRRGFSQWPANDVPLGLLGLSGDSAGRSREIPFEPGDMLVLVTDGFYEWTNSDEQAFGVERLTSVLQALAAASPEAIIAGLNQAVREFTTGVPQPDDLTALVVKRDSPERPARAADDGA
jgi:PAS domain S-box-containing protein